MDAVELSEFATEAAVINPYMMGRDGKSLQISEFWIFSGGFGGAEECSRAAGGGRGGGGGGGCFLLVGEKAVPWEEDGLRFRVPGSWQWSSTTPALLYTRHSEISVCCKLISLFHF